MKYIRTFFAEFFVVIVVAGLLIGCGFLKSSGDKSGNSAVSNTDLNDTNRITGTAPPPSPKAEKSDFTVTAEELDKIFTKKGVKKDELVKYANKTIAVTGRVSLISLEKKGTVQPWVTLYAPGILHGVSCYFDDDNLEQMKTLKMDKNIKVQGLMDDFIVPEISPTLKHCQVIKAD
jgi:tRNA_anti-like